MNAGSGEEICSLILRKLGLQCESQVTGGELILSPSGYDAIEGFSIRFVPGWRSAEAILAPGPFAGTMVRSMEQAGESEKQLFARYVAALEKSAVQIGMHVNGSAVQASEPGNWPSNWNSFAISLRKTALVFDLNKDAELLHVADLLVSPLAAMAIALIGTENVENIAGEIEGKPVQYLATRYERSRLNRDSCIRLHGTDCTGCGFSFGAFYGDEADGYIEIHHTDPVSRGGERQVSPLTDLVPLCSNCHSYVHRFDPPLPIADLRKTVAERKSKCSIA